MCSRFEIDITHVESQKVINNWRIFFQDFPKAKRTKIMNEWENSHAKIDEWVTRTQGLIDMGSGSMSTFDDLSVDEQHILWEDLETEMQANKETYEQALKDSKELIKYMKMGKDDLSRTRTIPKRFSYCRIPRYNSHRRTS